MGKRILCIGDSNTWGYIPGSGERYEKNVRWTGKLAQMLGENYEVIEEGMNGRTTAFTDKIEPGTAALDYLYPCLISQFPLDYIIVMLGTNDTKTRYGVNTVEIGYGLDEVLLKIEETCRRKSQTPEKIVIAPADLYPKKYWIEFTAESAQKAGGLTEEYRSIAALHHAEFLSARDVLGAECIGCDGIHFTEEGHRILAEAIALIIKNKEADECF